MRVWTNVGDAHIGFFGSREAIARAKAEILERATPATVRRRQRRRRARHVARGQVHGPARDVRRVGGRRRARAGTSSIAGSTARPPTSTTPGRRRCSSPCRWPAARSCRTCSPRSPWRSSSSIPLDGRSSRARDDARAGGAPRRDHARCRRRAARRRLLQRQPGRGARDARGARGDAARPAAASRCWARCSSWAIRRSRCTTRAAAPRRARASTSWSSIGGPPADGLVDGAVAGRTGSRAHSPLRGQRLGAPSPSRASSRRAISCSSKARAARGPIIVADRLKEGA